MVENIQREERRRETTRGKEERVRESCMEKEEKERAELVVVLKVRILCH